MTSGCHLMHKTKLKSLLLKAFQIQSMGNQAGFQMKKIMLFGGFHDIVSGLLEKWVRLDQLLEKLLESPRMAVILTGQMIRYMFGNIGLEEVLILVNLEQIVSESNAETQV